MFPSTTDVRDEAVRHLLVEEARLDVNEVAGEERQGGEAFFTAGRRKVKPVLALGFFLEEAVGHVGEDGGSGEEDRRWSPPLIRTRTVTRSRPGTERNMWRCAADSVTR